jgi:hypothetical protein
VYPFNCWLTLTEIIALAYLIVVKVSHYLTTEFFKQGEGEQYRMYSCQPTVGLVVSETKQNSFLYTNNQLFSRLTSTQGVDPLPQYRDFPDLTIYIVLHKKPLGLRFFVQVILL